MRYTYLVTVEASSIEQADQVIAERLDHDEDLGFVYAVSYGPERGRDFYTVAQAAERLGITRKVVTSLIAQGRIASFRFGRSRRICRSDLEHFIEASRQPPSAP